MNGAANFGILFRYFGFRYLNWVLALFLHEIFLFDLTYEKQFIEVRL